MNHPVPVGTQVPSHLHDVATALIDRQGETRRWLEELVSIPSISALTSHAGDLDASAALTAQRLQQIGMPDVRVVSARGSAPAVIGRWIVDDNLPTVLLYAHHDVQPVATANRGSSPPFEPTERDDRLYGRGTADDKAGIMAHVAALRAWAETRGQPPVNVKVLIEGEEEIGSPFLGALLEEYAELLRADTIVIADVTNWEVGWPAITRSLRGLVAMTVTVRALEQPVHSGMWGGAVPDALSGMAHLLASLHHQDGSIAVSGFTDDVAALTDLDHRTLDSLDYDDAALRRQARLLEGVQPVGDASRPLLERLWWHPAITPTGMDVPSVDEASNTLLSQVRAKLTLRLAPGQDPQRAADMVAAHLHRHVPWGLQVEVDHTESNAAFTTAVDGPAMEALRGAMTDAYGRQPAVIGCGGSIPFVGPFSEAFGGAACLLVGVEDPASNAHGEDESLHLEDFTRACLTEAFLLDRLAGAT